MKLVKIILGSFVLAGTVALPTQIAATETTTVNNEESTTINAESTTNNTESTTNNAESTTNNAESTTNNAESTTNNEEATIEVPEAQSPPIANTLKISEIFPDATLAATVAQSMNTAVDAIPTTAQLAAVSGVIATKGVADLTGLDKLTGLVYFNLMESSVSNIEVLTALPKLANLSLYSNTNIKKYDVVEGLVGLTTLSITDENITELPTLDALTALTALMISTPLVTDYSTVGSVTSLTTLYIMNGEANLVNIDFIKTLTNLQYLSLIGNAITDVSAIETLQNVVMLSIGSNEIEDISPLAALTNLEYLEASFNYVTDVSALADLPVLESVSMIYNSVSDISPLVDVKSVDLTNQVIFYEGTLPGADIYTDNKIKGLDGQLIAPALISDNGYYEDGKVNFDGMTEASRPAYTFNVGTAAQIPLPDLSGLQSASEFDTEKSEAENFMENAGITPYANERLAFSGIVAYFFTTTGAPITEATPATPTTGTTLPNTGENAVEKSVLGGSAVILGAIALVLKRRF